MANTTEKNVVLYAVNLSTELGCSFHSRSDQYPQCLAHQEDGDECRDIVGVEFAKRLDRVPLEANFHPLPESACDIEKIIPRRPVQMGQRSGQASEES